MNYPDNEVTELTQIWKRVSEQEKIIWENEAYHQVYAEETKKLEEEMKRMQQYIDETEKEDEKIEEQLVLLDESNEILQESLRIGEATIINGEELYKSLTANIEHYNKEYEMLIHQYEEEYAEQRSRYEETTPGYKELRAQQIEIKKLKIKEMDLKAKLDRLIKSQRQYDEIQKLMVQKTITDFAQLYLLQREYEETEALLQERKHLEQEMLKKYITSKSGISNKERTSYSKIKLPGISTGLSTNSKNENQTDHESSKKLDANDLVASEKKKYSDEIKHFFATDMIPLTITRVEYDSSPPHQEVKQKFNETNTKVRILESIVVNSGTSKPNNEKLRAESSITQLTPNDKPQIDKKSELNQIIEREEETHNESQNIPLSQESNSQKTVIPILKKNEGISPFSPQPTETPHTRSKFFMPSSNRKAVSFIEKPRPFFSTQPNPTRDNIFKKHSDSNTQITSARPFEPFFDFGQSKNEVIESEQKGSQQSMEVYQLNDSRTNAFNTSMDTYNEANTSSNNFFFNSAIADSSMFDFNNSEVVSNDSMNQVDYDAFDHSLLSPTRSDDQNNMSPPAPMFSFGTKTTNYFDQMF